MQLSFSPHYVPFGPIMVSQTLIASTIGTVLFLIFALIYIIGSKQQHQNKFVTLVDMLIEFVMDYLSQIGGKNLTTSTIAIVSALFFYVLWGNLVGLVGDMIVLAVPPRHEYFRPVGTDLGFNALLAVMGVVGSIIYGFKTKGLHHIEHYLPYRGIGIVPHVHNIGTFFGRIGDILMGVLIGGIELLSECGRMLSLSLRLFANLFVGMILLSLVTQAANAIFGNTPFLLPLVMFAYELVVAVLQAFIFGLLVTVYFKLASDHH